MTDLSERLRPDVDAAPWVIEEVTVLETENEALRAQYREICKTTHRFSRDKINLEAEVEHLRYAMKDAKYDLSKLKVSGGQYSVWQSYHGRIAYETLDRALDR